MPHRGRPKFTSLTNCYYRVPFSQPPYRTVISLEHRQLRCAETWYFMTLMRISVRLISSPPRVLSSVFINMCLPARDCRVSYVFKRDAACESAVGVGVGVKQPCENVQQLTRTYHNTATGDRMQ